MLKPSAPPPFRHQVFANSPERALAMSPTFALAPTHGARFQSGAFASPPASSFLAARNSSKAPASCQLGQAKAAFAGGRTISSAFIGQSCVLPSSASPRTGDASALPFFSTTTCQTSSSDVLSQSETLGPGFGSFRIDWDNGARQVMEGFGGGITWYGSWAVAHPNRDAIFDTVFSELKPSVLRIRNTFGQGIDEGGLGGQTTAELMEETAFVVSEGRKRLTGVDEFKILMCSWSPPAALKKSGTLNGGEGGSFGADTLRKDSRGVFIYEEFAQYWLESLKAYAAMGVEPMWISINNEPDWGGTGNLGGGHPVCIFRPSEDFFYPGYYRAFDEIYDTLKAGLEVPPLMCGPETAGFDNFETAPLNGLPEGFQIHPYSGNPRVHAICNHFYDAGVTYSNPNFFLNLDVSLRNARRHAVETQTKRMFMTEHANLALEKPSDPLDLARTIYQALTVAELNMYLQWDLLWGRSNEGTMVIIDDPFAGGFDASQRDEFETTQSFYWYKHRLATMDEVGLEGIWPLVFLSKVNSESTVILINSTDVWTRVECNYLPNEVEGFPRQVYYSTLAPEEKFVSAGLFPNESRRIWLKPSSITTIHSGEH